MNCVSVKFQLWGGKMTFLRGGKNFAPNTPKLFFVQKSARNSMALFLKRFEDIDFLKKI